jgi:hypothetical protein
MILLGMLPAVAGVTGVCHLIEMASFE